MNQYGTFHIITDIEVAAKSQEGAENYVGDIFEKASIFGVGLSSTTLADREPGTDVIRVFDFDYIDPTTVTTYNAFCIRMDIEVIATKHREGKDLVMSILHQAYIYGFGQKMYDSAHGYFENTDHPRILFYKCIEEAEECPAADL